MNILGCLDQATGGEYYLDGSEVSRLNDDQLSAVRARKIGFVFQGFNLLPRMTALEQVELPLAYAGIPNRRQRALEVLEWVGLAKVIVLGANVATNLYGTDEPVGQTLKISVGGRVGENFKVIGVTQIKGSAGFGDDDNLVFIPLTTMEQRVFSVETTRRLRNVTVINVQVASPAVSDQAVADLGNLLRDRHRVSSDDFTITTESDILRIFAQVTSLFTLLLAAIAGISLLVGGIGIMNIMLVSVTERTREIGIRRAIGARRQDILLQFLVEAIIVSLVGGAMGIALGFGIAYALARVPVQGQYLDTVVSASSVMLSFGVAALVGLFFGFFPAMRAARLHPIDALRYE